MSVESSTGLVSAYVGDSRVFMVETRRGELLLPVQPGANFGLRVQNKSAGMRAFPAVVGNGANWMNVYAECPITDPTAMPSTGGMWECRAHDGVMINAFALPGGQSRPFVAQTTGLGFGNLNANQIRIWERPPADPNQMIIEPGTAYRGQAVIDAGAVRDGQRVITDLGYLAADLLARVRIMTRDEVNYLLSVDEGARVTQWGAHTLPQAAQVYLRLNR